MQAQRKEKEKLLYQQHELYSTVCVVLYSSVFSIKFLFALYDTKQHFQTDEGE